MPESDDVLGDVKVRLHLMNREMRPGGEPAKAQGPYSYGYPGPYSYGTLEYSRPNCSAKPDGRWWRGSA